MRPILASIILKCLFSKLSITGRLTVKLSYNTFRTNQEYFENLCLSSTDEILRFAKNSFFPLFINITSFKMVWELQHKHKWFSKTIKLPKQIQMYPAGHFFYKLSAALLYETDICFGGDIANINWMTDLPEHHCRAWHFSTRSWVGAKI